MTFTRLQDYKITNSFFWQIILLQWKYKSKTEKICLSTINTQQSQWNKNYTKHIWTICQTGESQRTARLITRWVPGKKKSFAIRSFWWHQVSKRDNIASGENLLKLGWVQQNFYLVLYFSNLIIQLQKQWNEIFILCFAKDIFRGG